VLSILGFQNMLKQVFLKFLSDKVSFALSANTVKANEVSLTFVYESLNESPNQILFPAVTFTGTLVDEVYYKYYRFDFLGQAVITV
jgi:hypothetical protein